MRQAAKRQPQPWADGSPDLLRRLLARRTEGTRLVTAGKPAAAAEAELAFPDEVPSAQDAAILVLKAALRAERAEVTALQAQLAELNRGRR